MGLFLLAGFLHHHQLFEPGDRLFQDYLFRNHINTPENEQIILIAIDEISLGYFAQQKTYWPWPREFYAILIDYLTQHDAKVIALDLLLDTPDFDRLSYRADLSDERFARAVTEAGNVIIGLKTGLFQSELQPIQLDIQAIPHLDVTGCDENNTYAIITQPIPRFLGAARFTGDTQMGTESDGLTRKVPLMVYLDQFGFIPSLSFASLLAQFDNTPQIRCKNGYLYVDEYSIPVDENLNFKLKWYGKGGAVEGSFTYYSFQRVLRDAIGMLREVPVDPVISPGIFKNKTIIIGANAAGLADIKNTPVSSLASFPGMEIHATALQNIFDRSHITELENRTIWILLFLLNLSLVFVFGYRNIIETVAYLMVFILGSLSISAYLFLSHGILLPVTLLLLTGVVCFTGMMSLNYVTEGKEKRKINRAFNHYVQPEVVEEMLKDPQKLRLGGDKKELTILFTDLAGFSSLSEELEPEELIVFLIFYFGELSETIIKQKGTIDKYIGDSIMAFWGAPIAIQNHAEMACKAALEMQAMIPKIKEIFSGVMNYNPVTRIGINSGETVVGNIGSETRFDYTVLGDPVNLASRLEPLNKKFGTKIIISEYTHQQLPDNFLCRQLDLVRVMGINKPVKIFELLADMSADGTSEHELEKVRKFEIGLSLYRKMQWDEAIRCFNAVLEIDKNDGPSLVYCERCNDFAISPPPVGWEGIYELQTK